MEKKFVLYPLIPSQVVKDQVQMKQKIENEKKKILLENQKKVLRDNVEVWENSAPSHKVIQMEEKFEKKNNKVENILLSEQPPCLLFL